MSIYLDNAATKPLDTEEFNAITPYLLKHYSNPSYAGMAGIGHCRYTIAGLLNALHEKNVFTNDGTEVDNTVILTAVHESDRVLEVLHQIYQTLAA